MIDSISLPSKANHMAAADAPGGPSAEIESQPNANDTKCE